MNEHSGTPHFLRGALAILLGMIVLFWPGLTVEIVAIIFAVFILANGLLLISLSLARTTEGSSGTLLLLSGILVFIGGIIGVLNPMYMAVTLTLLIAVLAILSGLSDLWAAATAIGPGTHRILHGLSGLLLVILGGVFIIFPMLGAVILVAVYIGIFAIAIGILSIAQGFMTPVSA
ncbi:MAG: hypothetical protein D5R99_01930 [Methanocalculus sp. MSAO_Arc1]|uniref:HdeD family acid-resistance protein n=1 Tax=Methanocalculus TaxID=71151 RepID=UPI000FF064B0|nr:MULTISPECIES: DUF308 domain-containing protein [unclassified Methanocalculus]MCP1662343.1 hypothetical protein [Methanocalculus sp. AMF5]RQD81524.1 MAG: hypothetical protein D5R99_01930 [Methanocalculus sp. MSAO_Arc1]